MKKRLWAFLLALSVVLTACGVEEEQELGDFVVRASIGGQPETLDPAHVRGTAGQTVVSHLFENLLRWETGPNGQCALAPGQAESYTAEESYDGSVTYTFTLRRGLEWSDGRSITAQDFLYTWRRLFDAEAPAAGLSNLAMLRGYEAAMAGDLEALGVAAPDRYTFTVTIESPCAYFLDLFCAGVMTMPVPERAVRRGRWGEDADHLVTNGPYTLESVDGERAVLVRSGHYHDRKSVGPDQLEFLWEGSYEDFASGELDLIDAIPAETLSLLNTDGISWQLGPVLSTYTLLLNNAAEPFDNEFVRRAFVQAIDLEALLAALDSPTETAATGIVPRGVTERGAPPAEEEPPEDDLPPLPGTEPEEPEEPTVWDFRAAGDANRTAAVLSAEERRSEAARLLAQAGYPGGRGFPAVEYYYVNTAQNRLVAQTLRDQWMAALGVSVTIRAVSEEELRQQLLDGTYTCASFPISSGINDASAFLSRWGTGKVGNLVRSNILAYDLLIEIAGVTFDTAAREAYLHDAEEILLDSCGVAPLFFYGRGYAVASGLTGLCRQGSGIFHLQHLRRPETEGTV